MDKVTNMGASMTKARGKIVSEIKELSFLALVTAAATIKGPGIVRGLFISGSL
ncbi:hypothetical protein [Sphingomonas sp. PvP015]|uniref:hypothetical protein n=1 Tax=Sphingomonas sp. PvP015 TaxID=3156388 RepID=UPI003395D084